MNAIIDMLPTIDIAEAPTLLAEYVADPKKGPVIVTVNGHPLFVVLPVPGADVESISVSLNPKFNEIIERSRRRHDREGGISSEEMRRRLGLPPFVERKPRAKASKGKTNGRKPKANDRARKNDGQV